MSRTPPHPSESPATSHFTEAESLRVRRLVGKHGHGRARLLVGFSDGVFAALVDCGRVWRKRRDKVVAKLNAIEHESGPVSLGGALK